MLDKQTPTVTQTEEVAAETKITKYWWFLLILPLGIIIGSITSTCSTLKKDQAEQDSQKYVISVKVNQEAVLDDLNKLYNTPPRSNRGKLHFLSSSISNNPNQYLTEVGYTSESDQTLFAGYLNIEGREKEKVIVLALELDRPHSLGSAALQTISIAMIRSIRGEKDFRYTLRLVYLPKTATPEQHLLDIDKRVLDKGEELQAMLLLRELPELTEGQEDGWQLIAEKGNLTDKLKIGGLPDKGSFTVWSHPATLTDQSSIITETRFNLILGAINQLRDAVLNVAR